MEMPSWLKWTVALAVGLAIIGLSWWKAPIVLTIFFVMLCFVLIVVVLLQSGSAADLAGAFGGAGSQAAFNPRGAATFLSKATTWCAIMFMISAMVLALRQERPDAQGSSILERFSKPAPKPAQSPATKGSAPVTQTPPPQSPQQPQGAQQTPAQQQPLTSQPPPAKKP
ncbi:MAG TPA: preprotein translocase subunit SecG [Candidatus Dormibacteraeota bacterium]|nr:preprotein translocase subunit SecG [Candidatus Dormibacteraeota bacterium]